jgi:hypothetical protein
VASLRIKRKSDEIPTTRNIAARHYHASRPTGDPESTSPWRLPRRTLVSSCLSVIVFFRTGVTTSFPSDTETSTTVPSFTTASWAKGLGIRRARLLPHFCTRTRKAVSPDVSTKKIQHVSFRSQDGHDYGNAKPDGVTPLISCPTLASTPSVAFEASSRRRERRLSFQATRTSENDTHLRNDRDPRR